METVNREVEREGKDLRDFNIRKSVADVLLNDCKNKNGNRPEWLCIAYRDLRTLRNCMAHGTESEYKEIKKIIKEPQLLWKKLESIFGKITTAHRD